MKQTTSGGTQFMKFAEKVGVRASLAVGAVVVLAGCAVNAATGERQLIFMSEAQEIQMGQEADGQVTAAYGLVDNAALQDYVDRVGQRLAASSEKPGLPWSFKVVDDPIVNAFALPGGPIYMTRGILVNFDSEAEMAGVLGHEIGHVTARHSASQMSRQQLLSAGLGLGMVFSETFRQYGQLGMLGVQVLSLRYSRGDESQSDELGLRYITNLGYDPDAMIGVFDMLAQAGGGGGERLPEWQLTHPYPENREARMREIISESGMNRTGTVARDEYLDMIDGLVYGPNPREGFFRGTRFFQPDLAFEMTFPDGWTTINQRAVVAGIAPNEDGVITLEIADGGATPRLEVGEFLRQEGITGGTISEETRGGIERARATFEATTENGVLQGEVAFARMDGTTYRLTGYAPQAAWSSHAGRVAATISSFARVTDTAVLNVQPMRLDIVTVPEAMSLNSYYQRYGAPIPVEELAQLNRRAPGAVVSAGSKIKTVVGEPWN